MRAVSGRLPAQGCRREGGHSVNVAPNDLPECPHAGEVLKGESGELKSSTWLRS